MRLRTGKRFVRNLNSFAADRLRQPKKSKKGLWEVSIYESGSFGVRREAFENAGATWRVPFEDVRNDQFERGGSAALYRQRVPIECVFI